MMAFAVFLVILLACLLQVWVAMDWSITVLGLFMACMQSYGLYREWYHV